MLAGPEWEGQRGGGPTAMAQRTCQVRAVRSDKR
eukprot:SAG31_NODE_44411_length_263_cov_0.603659_1_plen_33_part_10